jgi:hypothetical protein
MATKASTRVSVPSLFKTTVTIWSEQDPRDIALDDGLGQLLDSALDGPVEVRATTVPLSDPDWIKTSAFDHLAEDE